MPNFPYSESSREEKPITFGAHPNEWPHPRQGQSCAQLAASIKSPPEVSWYCENVNGSGLLVLEKIVHTVVVTDSVVNAKGNDIACKFSDVTVTTKIHTGKPCPDKDYKVTLAAIAAEEELVRKREAADMEKLKAAIKDKAVPADAH